MERDRLRAVQSVQAEQADPLSAVVPVTDATIGTKRNPYSEELQLLARPMTAVALSPAQEELATCDTVTTHGEDDNCWSSSSIFD
jgi:hypothetical protein